MYIINVMDNKYVYPSLITQYELEDLKDLDECYEIYKQEEYEVYVIVKEKQKMRITTGLEIVKEKLATNETKEYVQDAIDYIIYLEKKIKEEK